MIDFEEEISFILTPTKTHCFLQWIVKCQQFVENELKVPFKDSNHIILVQSPRLRIDLRLISRERRIFKEIINFKFVVGEIPNVVIVVLHA